MSGTLGKILTLCSLVCCFALAVLWVAGYSTSITFLFTAERFTLDRSAVNEERHVWTRWFVGIGRGGLGIARLRSDGPAAVVRLHGYDQTQPSRISWIIRQPPRHPADAWSNPLPAPPATAAASGALAPAGWQWRRGPFLAHHERRPDLWSPTAGGPFVWKTQTDAAVAFPIAIPVALFAVPPLRRLLRAQRRSRRLTQGRCGQCGYDIRATPARCPDCGASQLKGEGKRRGTG